MKVEKEVEGPHQSAEAIFEEQQEALNVLVNFVRLAHKRGAFELEETEVIVKAIKVFSTKQD